MHPAIFVGELFLLFQVHAAIGFGQELFCILAVLGVKSESDAKRQNIFATDLAAGLLGQSLHLLRLLFGRVRREPGSNHYELVPTHARDVVILTATVLQSLRKQAQHAIAFQVPETIVDLFKTIHVRDHHGQ